MVPWRVSTEPMPPVIFDTVMLVPITTSLTLGVTVSRPVDILALRLSRLAVPLAELGVIIIAMPH